MKMASVSPGKTPQHLLSQSKSFMFLQNKITELNQHPVPDYEDSPPPLQSQRKQKIRLRKNRKNKKLEKGKNKDLDWAGHQSGVACEQGGIRVAGNISTLACMKDRSGRAAITLAASSLRFSSFLGFLWNRRRT